MTEPFYVGEGLTVYAGDCRQILAELPAESIHAVVTSPPYWGLRDYGTASWTGGDSACDHLPGRQTSRAAGKQASNAAGAAVAWKDRCRKCGAERVDAQLGLEATPEAYVEDLVAIFREVRRVLRPEGTVWLNIGDSYAGSWGAQSRGSDQRDRSTLEGGLRTQGRAIAEHPQWSNLTGTRGLGNGVKPKDLVGIPWRVAFALQADGWFLRCDVIWSKPNPMPESVTDRPTRSHEYLFLLAKQPRYFFDAEAVREADAGTDHARRVLEVPSLEPSGGLRSSNGGLYTPEGRNGAGRNIRSVWTIAAEPYAGAHFATFPTRLVEPCVKAGTSERGCCPECGAPWTRVVERSTLSATPRGTEPSQSRANLKPPQQSQIVSSSRTLGWQPSCSHGREPGDWDVIRTPVGAGGLEDTSLTRGRRGLGRRRAPDEGSRPMYRWQQRAYARQLRDSPFADAMRGEAGTAFDHYARTDLSGARAIPPDLLDRWTGAGWITEPEEPTRPTEPLEPAVVLDPFAGSGTTGRVAAELGRRAILIDLNPEYVRQAIVRASHGYADPGGQDVPADSLWTLEEATDGATGRR